MRPGAISNAMKVMTLVVPLALSTPALCQDTMVLGPRQFESDTSGQVLCVWWIYLAMQAEASACGLPRQPIDDAVDEAIVAIDQFILDNSSLHPTRAMLDEYKRQQVAGFLANARRTDLQKICTGHDLQAFRSISPDHYRADVKKLLAKPREPVVNPCL